MLIYTSILYPQSTLNGEKITLQTTLKDMASWVVSALQQPDQYNEVNSPEAEAYYQHEDVEMGDNNAGAANETYNIATHKGATSG